MDMSYEAKILAHINYQKTYKKKDKLINNTSTNAKDGLIFKKVNAETLKIIVYLDGSFSSNNDGSFQVGDQMFIASKYYDSNVD